MKYSIIIGAMLLCTTVPALAAKARILEQKQGSITFVVDENLPKPQNERINWLSQAERLKSLGDSIYYGLENSYIASSFWDTPLSDDDAPFFTGMVQAFADHRPVSLSPDLIWMLISQAFSQEVNANPEKFRNMLVDFDGKVDLVIETKHKLYDPDFDWTATIDGFAEKIDANTRNDVARLLTANYSTTGTVERMASEIVLMETTKPFFNFIVMYLSCGIPSVTLTGTSEDWQSVLDKTVRLKELGAGSWVSDMEPVLEQFVRAAQGHPDQAFWQDMVMKNTPSSLRGGGCSLESPTELDGWFLKLMPYDKDGKPTPAKVPHNYRNFHKQMSSVPVRYIEVDSLTGIVKKTTQLKLSGGIAGYMADENDCVSFKIGWAVNKSDVDETIEKLKQQAPFGITLRVNNVPEELRAVRHYHSLELRFTDKVIIPAWMDSLKIDKLIIQGKLSQDEQKSLRSRFGKNIEFKQAVGIPQESHVITPLVILDGNIVEMDEDKLSSFDFEKEHNSREKLAALLGLKSSQLKAYRILKDAVATAIWGTRGRYGVLEIISSDVYNNDSAFSNPDSGFKLLK